MERVNSYKDSRGGLHPTPKACMEREIQMQVGAVLNDNDAGREVAFNAYKIAEILNTCIKSYEDLLATENTQP